MNVSKWYTDIFNHTFLDDFEMSSCIEGYDPYNHIGLESGINLNRAICAKHYRYSMPRRQAE